MMSTSQSIHSPAKGEDEKEAIILGHCILNMNTRAPGIAVWEGGIVPVLRALKRYYGEKHQYPCLEASVVGMRRWWHVKEQYNTFTFRFLSQRLSQMYSHHFLRNGITKVKVLGLGLSPTCGLRYTQSDPTYGGRPREIDPSRIIKRGKGVLIEEMDSEFKRAGLDASILDVSPSLIYPEYEERISNAGEYPATPYEALEEIESFLEVKLAFRDEEISRISSLKEDIRSKRTLVIPRKLLDTHIDALIGYAERGVGITLIEDIYGNEEERELLSFIYASMLANMVLADHSIRIAVGNGESDELVESIMEKLEESRILQKISIRKI
ncbi:MAG: hypothetical protein QW437_06620 [Fervidicoccaceae archaeon]